MDKKRWLGAKQPETQQNASGLGLKRNHLSLVELQGMVMLEEHQAMTGEGILKKIAGCHARIILFPAGIQCYEISSICLGM